MKIRKMLTKENGCHLKKVAYQDTFHVDTFELLGDDEPVEFRDKVEP